jgi:hypothetical protein
MEKTEPENFYSTSWIHIYLNQGKVSTFADGEFWSRKSTISLGLDDNEHCFIFSDFKLYKEGNSTFNKSGTKEST